MRLGIINELCADIESGKINLAKALLKEEMETTILGHWKVFTECWS